MRVVSLCPSITESLVALGLAEALVGITRFCIHPKDVVRGVRKVGGTKDPDLAAILALKPDLVFLNEEENRREDFEILSKHLQVETSLIRRVDEVPEHLLRLGALTGAVDASKIEAELLQQALATLMPRFEFSYAYLIWREPWMSVSNDTYVADLVGRAGGRNVFAGAQDRYPSLSLTELVQLSPQVVLLPDEPFPFKERHATEIKALLPDAHVRLVSGDDCCWHGVRSRRGVALMQTLQTDYTTWVDTKTKRSM